MWEKEATIGLDSILTVAERMLEMSVEDGILRVFTVRLAEFPDEDLDTKLAILAATHGFEYSRKRTVVQFFNTASLP